MNVDTILHLFVAIGAAVGVYVGVKSDLAVTRQIAETARDSAARSHSRIDSLLQEQTK